MTQRSRNVAKLMARLNPKNARLDMGTGGGPSEDSPDMVAGALGWAAINHPGLRLAIQVLCLKWWPSTGYGPERLRATGRFETVKGAPRPRGGMLSAYPYTELDQRRAIMARVQPQSTARQEARDILFGWLRRKVRSGAYPMPPKLIERLNANPNFWPVFFDTVLDEYLNPSRCTQCLGHGEHLKISRHRGIASSKRITCPTCEGRGIVDRSSNRRARAVGINAQDFHTYLKPLYLWLLNLIRHLEYRAAQAVNRALRDGKTLSPEG